MEMQYTEKFEYTYKLFHGSTIGKIIEELNQMGQEGWELILHTKDELGRSRYVLKRKILCKTI